MAPVEPFTFVDGERLLRFGSGVLAEAGELLVRRGFAGYALLTTERARDVARGLETEAVKVIEVGPGPVPELATAHRSKVGGLPLVALGGGRVVDVAKAIAGADGLACAAIPTTLAGSSFTPFHRLPNDAPGARMVRPALVIADPNLMASAPLPLLAATAMNAFAHAFEALYTPLANPVSEGAALAAAAALSRGLADRSGAAREELALGAALAGYAVGTTGFAIHHATCQTIVRVVSTPHAETNAVVLPHSVDFMVARAPREVGLFAEAIGADGPAAASRVIASLAAGSGIRSLSDLGIQPAWIPHLAKAVAEHPALANTPGVRPAVAEVEGLLVAAL
ncbi:MAG: iron-containing alcohol dehydrogenase [Thermoleophilaceae bacterium]|nr:iron-containing alcohol dehydrogenase [Thermoleophilaceae bacterium]